MEDSLRRDDLKPAEQPRRPTRKVMMWAIMLGGNRNRMWSRILPYRRAQRALRLIKHLGYTDAYLSRFGHVRV